MKVMNKGWKREDRKDLKRESNCIQLLLLRVRTDGKARRDS
jgi:hypothetical protein